jgi:DNA-binding MarR family transcriptional regulator
MSTKQQQKGEPLSKERLRLWIKLLKAHSSLETELRRRCREQFKTTLPRFDVLSALARTPNDLKMGEISVLLKVSNGNITGIVDRLTEDGLVIRVAAPSDRRAQLVRLTNAGMKSFNEMAKAHEAWLNELLGSLDIDKLNEFQNLLDDVTNHFKHIGVNDDA